MRVTILKTRRIDGRVYHEGDAVSFPANVCASLIASGVAEAYEAPVKKSMVEKAVATKPTQDVKENTDG